MDEELNRIIREARRGSKDAFAILVHRFKDHVYRYAYGMIGDRMEAEDIAQEAFLKCFAALPRLENEFSFVSWLNRIVSNLCADRLRKRSKERLKAASVEALDAIEISSAQEQQRVRNLKMTIEEAMKQLSLDHRQIILLHDVQGFRYEEIARMLEIPVGTVKSRLNSARLALRLAMRRGEEEE
ncbi:RNA polymerase sigma factor [Cohnella sp. AR92]|uniref:RNA polymerase sigma factor n=1 Tax=Cohnella sp. AR92 TaxID=648716 RepID=UPI000F8EED42|nr:sigma-70 family RNA polymerase sigma factor [Cohnella sp. AR92]RUS46976.1 sigma-70 family RNA polymerase sigma factor [Cohnella sp. AR92]